MSMYFIRSKISEEKILSKAEHNNWHVCRTFFLAFRMFNVFFVVWRTIYFKNIQSFLNKRCIQTLRTVNCHSIAITQTCSFISAHKYFYFIYVIFLNLNEFRIWKGVKFDFLLVELVWFSIFIKIWTNLKMPLKSISMICLLMNFNLIRTWIVKRKLYIQIKHFNQMNFLIFFYSIFCASM